MHQENGDTLVDLNRAGVALIEIVTEPALHSAHEAGLVLSEARRIVRYLEICDGNMEEGSLRCDANVSVREKGAKELGQKVEVKNMNSIRNVQKAIDYEIVRQIEEIENGYSIISETRTFEVNSGKTFGMRTKEELNDYRYFPDPDLSPVLIDDIYLEKIKSGMPELPCQLVEKLTEKMGLPEYDAELITESRELVNYFLSICDSQPNYKIVSNWIMGPVKSYLNERNEGIEEFPIPANKMAQFIFLIDSGRVSHDTASKVIFPELLRNPDLDLEDFIKSKHLDKDVGPMEIKNIIAEVLNAYPDKVLAYKNGKKGLIGLFMGEIMKKTKGKANPKETNLLLKEALD
jgi:aspartyl-tRNA(Asn)/glutamyl-tRNA(Gln) amidotransferase subunit B